MKLNFKKTFNIVLIFLILLITLCAVSAQDNDTQIISQDMASFENEDNELSIDYGENACNDSQIEVNVIEWYCNENNVLESYIKDTLLNCSTFSLTKRTKITTNKDEIVDSEVEKSSRLNDVHFTEMIKYGDKKLDIFHLILANEDSEAGKIYNKYSYDFIESIYNLISEPKKFDVFEKVKASFRKTSKIILNEKIEKLIFTENEKILKDKIIKLESKEDLSLKKCYMDELGFALFKSPDLELKYNYFKADENTLEIRVEVPGNSNCVVLHTVEGEYTIISIKGKKRNDKQPAEPKHNIFNLR